MCRYIKDDGDQCGREAEPFCHDHNETVQAVQFEIQQLRDDFGEALLEGESGSSDDLIRLDKYSSMEEWKYDIDKYIYVIAIERFDGEIFYYVGETTDMYERMRTHRYRSSGISIPTRDGVLKTIDIESDDRYEILGLERLIPVPNLSNEERRNVERKISYRVAIDNNTTNVIGGR